MHPLPDVWHDHTCCQRGRLAWPWSYHQWAHDTCLYSLWTGANPHLISFDYLLAFNSLSRILLQSPDCTHPSMHSPMIYSVIWHPSIFPEDVTHRVIPSTTRNGLIAIYFRYADNPMYKTLALWGLEKVWYMQSYSLFSERLFSRWWTCGLQVAMVLTYRNLA